MIKKICLPFCLILLAGCIRETYDFNRFSGRAHLSPTWAVPVIRGDVSFSDLVEPNDTIIFEEDDLVRIVLRENSLIDLKVEDYYDLDDMISFSEKYRLGKVNLSSFSGAISYTLDRISQSLTPALRAQFVSLDGKNSAFPAIPVTGLQESAYSLFSNFEHATFDEGSIDIHVRNNLTAPLENISVSLYNTAGHTLIGNTANIALINPGETGSASIDLANSTVLNSLTAAVTISSPGTSVPVYIDLDAGNIEVSVAARDLWVRSGKIVVPTQNISSLGDDGTDTITFDPGAGIEIVYISMEKGDLSYTIRSGTALSSDVSLTMPTILQDGSPLTKGITVNPEATIKGSLSVDNSVFDLSTISTQPFNMMPVEHIISVSSNGRIINFSSDDEVQIDLRFLNPGFDYVKGYFGQESESFGPVTIDPGISQIVNKLSGDLNLVKPSFILNYSNSFAVPIEVDLQAWGYKRNERTGLQMNPFELVYPDAPGERDINSVFVIDKNNSSLNQLFSMPPYMIVMAGSARMNPQGNNGSRNNYIFGNSRISGSLEIDLPMEFRMNNLQFTDTVDNNLPIDDSDGDNPFDPGDFEFLRIIINAENGFPAGISVSMILYDTENKINLHSVHANDILTPANVDNSGRVTTPSVSSVNIDIPGEFWDDVDQSGNIIFVFTLNSTGNGTKDVKIYSDYRINFTAGIVVRPDLKFNLN